MDGAAVSGIKASVGHLEPAAGMIGLQSLLSALIASEGAPNAQLRVLNPKVAATLEVCSDRWPLQGATSRLPFSSERVAAGVSSFGYSGTIAHAILTATETRAAQYFATAAATTLRFRHRVFAWNDHHALSTTSHIPFLGALVSESSSELIWEQHFSPFELVFLQDHRVGSVPLLPGTCYIEMARAVVRAAHDEASAFDLTSVAFSTILFLDEADITPNVRVCLDRRPGRSNHVAA